MVKKILFVCRHNRFRSKVAEAIFNKVNKNKNWKAESAGLFLDVSRLYIEPTVMREMQKRNYSITGNPRQLTRELAKEFDKIVIAADNIDKRFFDDLKIKVVQWPIVDCSASDVVCIEETVDNIEERVKDLAKKL